MPLIETREVGYLTRDLAMKSPRRPTRPQELQRQIAGLMREFLRRSQSGDRHGAVEVSRRMRSLEAQYLALGR